MSLILFLSLNLASPGIASAADSRPRRVVSINLCTDQLLLMLADVDQVASLSYLAREPENSFVARQAMGYPANHGRLEEILSLRPDLVLTSDYSSPRLLSTLASLGLRVESLHLGRDAKGIAGNIRHLANLLHQRDRGEALVARMTQRLRSEEGSQNQARLKAIFYQPRGYTSGRETLQDEALQLAGWRNPAAEQGLVGYLPVDLERVLLWQPDLIFTSVTSGSGDSRAERQLDHPALVQMLAGRPIQEIPYKYWICPGPMLAEAVETLRRIRAAFSTAPVATNRAMTKDLQQMNMNR